MATGTVAEATPLGGLAVTVRMAGVVPESGDTERKLLHVVSEILAANGEAPAVLARARVCVCAVTAPPGAPGAPAPKEVRVSDAGFDRMAGADTTRRITGMLSGVLLVPATAIATE